MDTPALPELMDTLWEMAIYSDLEMFPPTGPEAAPTRGAAVIMLRQMLSPNPLCTL